MTLQHRNTARRHVQARQIIPGPGGEGGPGPRPGGPGNGPPSSAPRPQPSTEPSNSIPDGPQFTRPTPTPTPPPPSTSAQVDRPTTTPAAVVTTTSTQAQPTTTASSSDSSSSSSSSSVVVATTRTVNTLTAPGRVATSSFATLSRTTLIESVGTGSALPSATAEPSSGIKVGPIVGGIAGALVGIAILGFLISFILRRMRKRNHRDTLYEDDFRRSQFAVDGDGPLDPPSMTQRHHSVTPSVSSGPGMAGYGAYQTNAAYGAGAAPAIAGYGATAGGAPLQERPRYTYGQGQGGADDDASDIAHGAYSSQPQPQASYNPEAYGSYATYETNSNAAGGYQEATRQYQGPHAYAQGGYDGQYAQYDNYVVADSGPHSAAGAVPVAGAVAVGAHPTAREPASMSGNRGPNTRSVVQDDDVYGGI